MIRYLLAMAILATSSVAAAADKPNILWIVVEDASPNIGCYGETAIKTPNLDQLAREGVRFNNALVTCPVCSPVRSALVTGMYQTTLGAHHHRSARRSGKGAGNEDYYSSYSLPASAPLISHLFRDASYYTCNGSGPAAKSAGKTDYNFVPSNAYHGADWRKAGDKPFFAQIQLKGGKSRPRGSPVGEFQLPPYYPDDPVLRKDWSEYLSSWEKVDQEVGQIVANLKKAGVYENTLIAFITDHGVSHLRGKQFLYEEGVRIPMILRFPDKRHAGVVREDLALHIDLAPISLAYAGLPVPGHLQGEDLFAAGYQPREFAFSARDRCDETLEILRSVRTQRFKYIRNFLSYRPHLQFNQYKDGKEIVKQMRSLHKAGKLNALQSRFFTVPRPTEELYDLVADPHETNNLAGSPKHSATQTRLRKALYQWMVDSGDPGLIAEPVLEDLGKKHGSKLAAMAQPAMRKLVPRLIAVIEAGERKDGATVRNALAAADPAERYWAATWAGVNKDAGATDALKKLVDDPAAAVRVAASLSLCQLGLEGTYFAQLVSLIEDPNLIVGMYAMNAIEQSGIRNEAAARAAELAKESNYEFTRRYGKRLATLVEVPNP
ncbi:MAG: sulfatase-like hydrolase/transferase [Roseibacillus sp.]